MGAHSSTIISVQARQILDSRGRPTVEADVLLEDGSRGRACVPSGASTGRHEAAELRDRDPLLYEGRGVLTAVASVNGVIAQHVAGFDCLDQNGLDAAMTALDPSPRLETIGANAVLAVSLASSRAGAQHCGMPLHRYIQKLTGTGVMTMPMPMTNILSGGAHAGRSMDLQDFLVMPVGASTYREALEMIIRVRSSAARLMADQGMSVLLADEGGLSPGFAQSRVALELMMRSFEHAGLRAGEDVAIALDVAASELAADERYVMHGMGQSLSGPEMIGFIEEIVADFPIVSVEDPLDQDDWTHWRQITAALPDIQIVGDDLFVTNEDRIRRGIEQGVANCVLIKVNQNGTLSGTLDAMRAAQSGGYGTVVSARSGETEDSYIADLAVGSGAGQIKIGSVRNSERLAKYNQLLRIDEDGDLAFAGVNGCRGRFGPLARAAA